MLRRREIRLATIAVVAISAVLVAAAGCGGDDYDAGAAANTQAPAATTAAGTTAVKIADVAKLGKVLVDPAGLTLYTFNNDVANSGKSTCNGACAATWPPLVATDAALVKPVGLVADLGVITRDDGKKQVTYGGRPLYRFAADKSPGDAGGQGLSGVWFAAPVQPAAATGTPSEGGGYGYGY